MNKADFLHKLKRGIEGLPEADVARWLEYYTEMLEDRIEEGMSEEEAVASLGEPTAVARQILSQTPLSKLIQNKMKPKRKLLVWEIILLCVGSPIWASVVIAVAAVIFSGFASLWAGIISVWAGELSIMASAVAGVVSSPVFLALGNVNQGLLLLGGGLVCAGLAYYGFFFSKWLTVLLLKLCKLFLLFVKSWFVEKEGK